MRRSSASTSARRVIAFTRRLEAQTRAREPRTARTPRRTRERARASVRITSSAPACCITSRDPRRRALRALRDVLAPEGALHFMVYAPYGRVRHLHAAGFLAAGSGGATATTTWPRSPRRSRRCLRTIRSFRCCALAGFFEHGRLGRRAFASARPRVLRCAVFRFLATRRPAIRPLGPPGAVLARVRRIGIHAARRSAGRPERTRTICGDGALSRYDGSPQRHCSSQR